MLTIPPTKMPSGKTWMQDVPTVVPEWPLLLMLRWAVRDTLYLNFSGSMRDIGQKVQAYYTEGLCVLSPLFLNKIEGWLRLYGAAAPRL